MVTQYTSWPLSHYTLILSTSYFILHTSYFILHTSYFILHTSYFILHTSYFILHTSYFILHTSYFYIILLLHLHCQLNIIITAQCAGVRYKFNTSCDNVNTVFTTIV